MPKRRGHSCIARLVGVRALAEVAALMPPVSALPALSNIVGSLVGATLAEERRNGRPLFSDR